MPTCQGRYAPPEAVALLLPQARTILKYALFYHGTGHLQKILNIADIFKIRIGLREEIPQEIDFFSSNGQLKAYYEIDVGDRWHDTYPFYFNCVVIGPQCKASITEVQAFLLRHGILGCSVIKNSWAQMR